MAIRSYRVSFAKKSVIAKVLEMPDGTIEQYLVRAKSDRSPAIPPDRWGLLRRCWIIFFEISQEKRS